MAKKGAPPPWLAKAAERKLAKMKHKPHGKAKPNPNAPLGQGGRFAALRQDLQQKGVANPDALAAAIGRRKYGKKRFAALGNK